MELNFGFVEYLWNWSGKETWFPADGLEFDDLNYNYTQW